MIRRAIVALASARFRRRATGCAAAGAAEISGLFVRTRAAAHLSNTRATTMRRAPKLAAAAHYFEQIGQRRRRLIRSGRRRRRV